MLTRRISFPCPADELAEGLRKENRTVIIVPAKPENLPKGNRIGVDELDALADTENKHREKQLLCRWGGADTDWILSEDKPATEQFGNDG